MRTIVTAAILLLATGCHALESYRYCSELPPAQLAARPRAPVRDGPLHRRLARTPSPRASCPTARSSSCGATAPASAAGSALPPGTPHRHQRHGQLAVPGGHQAVEGVRARRRPDRDAAACSGPARARATGPRWRYLWNDTNTDATPSPTGSRTRAARPRRPRGQRVRGLPRRPPGARARLLGDPAVRDAPPGDADAGRARHARPADRAARRAAWSCTPTRGARRARLPARELRPLPQPAGPRRSGLRCFDPEN